MTCLFKAGSFLISSDLIASQLLLDITHCTPLSLQSVSPSPHLISSHVVSSQRFSPHLISPSLISSHVVSSQRFSPHLISPSLISSHLISCLFSFSKPFSADRNCSHLFSCHLSLSPLLSAHLDSSLFSYSQPLHSTKLVSTQLLSALHRSSHVRSSQLIPSHLIADFSGFLSSSQLMSAPLMSSHLFRPLLTSSKLLSALLTSSQLISALLSSPSDHLRISQKTCSKTGSRRQSHEKYNFIILKPFEKQIQKENGKRQKEKVIENSPSQLWRNHSNAICKQQVLKDHGTTTVGNSNIEQQ